MHGGVKHNYDEHKVVVMNLLTSVSKNCRRCYFNKLDW